MDPNTEQKTYTRKQMLLLLTGLVLMILATYYGFASAVSQDVYRKILTLSLALDALGIIILVMAFKASKWPWRIIPAALIVYGLSIAPQAIQRLSIILTSSCFPPKSIIS